MNNVSTTVTIGGRTKELGMRILVALYKYYLEDVTFERAAREADVTIHELIEYVNENHLPMTHTERDVIDGFKKVRLLMIEEGVKVEPLIAG